MAPQGDLPHQLAPSYEAFLLLCGGSLFKFQDSTTFPRPAKESPHKRKIQRFISQN